MYATDEHNPLTRGVLFMLVGLAGLPAAASTVGCTNREHPNAYIGTWSCTNELNPHEVLPRTLALGADGYVQATGESTGRTEWWVEGDVLVEQYTSPSETQAPLKRRIEEVSGSQMILRYFDEDGLGNNRMICTLTSRSVAPR